MRCRACQARRRLGREVDAPPRVRFQSCRELAVVVEVTHAVTDLVEPALLINRSSSSDTVSVANVDVMSVTCTRTQIARSGVILRAPYGRLSTWPRRFVGRPGRDSAGGLEVTVEIATTTTTLVARRGVHELGGVRAGRVPRRLQRPDPRGVRAGSAAVRAVVRRSSVALFWRAGLDIEAFGRHLEDLGRARATIARRLCTIACFYRYAEEEGLIAVSPAVHVRRPRLDYESHAVGLDRNEVGAMLVAAGLAGARDHALMSLLALNGLRISEAIGADIEQLGLERGHRTLTILRKGGKTVTIPLAPRTARAIDLAVGERSEGPIFLARNGERLDRHAASRIVRRIARRAGITKRVGPHTLRHAFITAALDAGVPLRDVQEAASHADPRTTMRYDRARVSLDRHATYIVATFIAGAAR